MTARPRITAHPARPGGEPTSPSGIARRTAPARSVDECVGTHGAASSPATTANGPRQMTPTRAWCRADRALVNPGADTTKWSAGASGARSIGARPIAARTARSSHTATAGAKTSPGGQ